jgi:hypothetical protein
MWVARALFQLVSRIAGSAAAERVGWGEITAGRGGVIFDGWKPRPDEPQLSAGAVFIGSGIVLLVLGAVL